MTLKKSKIERILLIKPRAIGDVVLASVVIKNLRSAFPSSEINFLTENPSHDVTRGNPDISNTIVFNSKSQSGLELIAEVSNHKYDLVIDLFGNPRTAIVTLMSGARYRVGYKFGWRKFCYNIVVEPRGGSVHNIQFNLDALRAIDVPIIDTLVHFPVGDSAENFARRFFLEEHLEKKFVVALNPGGGWYTKKWRLHQFAEFGDLLVERYGASILLLWGPGEHGDALKIQSLMNHPSQLIPPTTLKELAAIMQQCSMMVTNDSGPMHIAASVGTPTVAIFGPTNPTLQGPAGNESEIVRNERLICLGCNYTTCPIGNLCMEELSVQEVLGAFEKLKKRITLN